MITAERAEVVAHYKDSGINHLWPKSSSVRELLRCLQEKVEPRAA